MPVTYWINEKGFSKITNGSDFLAVHSSFHAWETVASADVQFVSGGTTTAAGVGRDGMNVVSFTDTSAPMGSSTIAATFSFFKRDTSGLTIDEADIAFNPALDFSTSAEQNKFDIQSVLTHEIGHLLGLDHSAMVSSVMVPFGTTSQLDQRTLAYDDIAGITELYPKPSTTVSVGQIRGVVRSGGTPVLGAHVVAVSNAGTALVSTLSQPDGSYTLRFLPEGTYKVFAEPLDLPVTKDNIGGGFYANTRTDFGTTYFGNVSTQTDAPPIALSAGAISTADIDTLPKSSTGLNLTRPAFGIRVARGVAGTLTTGGEDITSGVAFTTSSSGIVLGSPTFGGSISSAASTSAQMNVSVATNAPIGPINFAVNRGTDASIVSGAFVITDTAPRNMTVTPMSGSAGGGTAVTVRGVSFRPGAQVYFGGLPASGVSVVDSGTILVNAPQNSPGAMNVVVVNSDGTWGSASGAFTYEALPPVITSVTPLIGPPATLVVIGGENFDSRLQNVAVQFNGNPARVISATSNTITTVAPFGVTTGPITVSIFGKSVTGPVFTATAPSPSTNLATPAFNFIDASVAAGGANLVFTSDDDAVASAVLPFNFTLFRDIYLAGSAVSISTNGFLSFESVPAGQTFQNGPLPGQSVSQPMGGTGVIPPSLIAPFWDDLVMKSGSTISARTVGNAPNRQFVVEWSNMSILDENGNDRGASLVFEAVLFEGSNDIQFLYNSMSGPFSDGSSATIGAQNLSRSAAIQTGFNQTIVSSSHFKTYHFNNGAYTELAPDASPPSTPVVTDEGALTANRTQLAASWVSQDPESGIREFQYAIGTSPGGTEVKSFESTTQNSIVVTGLNLQPGTTYYFAVKAINTVGLVGNTSVSDGIQYDPEYQPQIKMIPSAPESSSQFTGLALLAPTAMSVVLRAYDSNGGMVFGSGIRNPSTVSLAAGQQYARLIPELLGLQSFDGWVEVEASAPGLGIFAATGGWDMSTLDGSVARDTSDDFVLFHAGANGIFVNPSSRVANVTMTSLSGLSSESFSIPSRGRVVKPLRSAVRVQSSEALAAIERSDRPGKLAINEAVPVRTGQVTLVFPQAVVGAGYTSTLTLANIGGNAQVRVNFPGVDSIQSLGANTVARIPITSQVGNFAVGALTASATDGSSIVGVLDIENETGLVTIGARPAATEFVFPHLANGNGLFTGLAFATGSSAARITIEIFEAAGGAAKSVTITLGANQQLARQVSELVAGAATQVGGYIRIRSDQPIWAWEIYGSGQVMASGPPL
jgi:Matrixin/IPT/TIG domain/Carboxypeptidase regulatory-like domain